MKQLRVMLWMAVLLAGGFVAMKFATAPTPIAVTGSGPGGPFTLTSHTGDVVRDTDFQSRFMLIYFGYSFCPDVCPIELQKMTTALHMLEAEGYDTTLFQPIFITVDPERDTVESLAQYKALFHDRMLMLTGSVEDIAAVAGAYKIYYKRVDDPALGTYLMDHFSGIFAMGPVGDFQRLFTSNDSAGDIAEVLRPILDATGGAPEKVGGAR